VPGIKLAPGGFANPATGRVVLRMGQRAMAAESVIATTGSFGGLFCNFCFRGCPGFIVDLAILQQV